VVAWSAESPDMGALDFFLCGCMKLRVYQVNKPEVWHQLVEAINVATIGVRNEIVRLLW
jgi:hypothetical protein